MIPFTGFAYLVGSAAFLLLTLRFYRYFRKEASLLSKMLFFFAFSFLLFFSYTALASLFFFSSPVFLKTAVLTATFFQGIGCSFLAYLLFSFKKTKVLPWLGFFAILVLTFVAIFFAWSNPKMPAVANSAISWNTTFFSDGIRAVIHLVTFLPLALVFFYHAVSSFDKDVRQRAFWLGILMLFGVLTVLVEFLFEKVGAGELAGDIAQSISYLVLLVFLITTQKHPH